jgi:membrane protein required for colicin V production
MPITILDLVLLVVMLISALLAMVRGFLREVLSIAAWVFAAFATVWLFPKALPIARQYIAQELVATAVVVAGLFLITLILVSMVTIKISDMVLDSRIGALDRTLGFVFGLGRGLLIVVVAFLFFAWLVPERGHPDWVRNAKSKVVLQSTGQWLMSLLPQDLDTSFMNRLRPQDAGEPPAAAPPAPRT